MDMTVTDNEIDLYDVSMLVDNIRFFTAEAEYCHPEWPKLLIDNNKSSDDSQAAFHQDLDVLSSYLRDRFKAETPSVWPLTQLEQYCIRASTQSLILLALRTGAVLLATQFEEQFKNANSKNDFKVIEEEHILFALKCGSFIVPPSLPITKIDTVSLEKNACINGVIFLLRALNSDADIKPRILLKLNPYLASLWSQYHKKCTADATVARKIILNIIKFSEYN